MTILHLSAMLKLLRSYFEGLGPFTNLNISETRIVKTFLLLRDFLSHGEDVKPSLSFSDPTAHSQRRPWDLCNISHRLLRDCFPYLRASQRQVPRWHIRPKRDLGYSKYSASDSPIHILQIWSNNFSIFQHPTWAKKTPIFWGGSC